MVDSLKVKTPAPLSKKELLQRKYDRRSREIRIARTRAGMVRNQLLRAYEILENIRFDFISDTMFREYVVVAKQKIEGAISDFLLRDEYWQEKLDEHRKMSPEEYDKSLRVTMEQGSS